MDKITLIRKKKRKDGPSKQVLDNGRGETQQKKARVRDVVVRNGDDDDDGEFSLESSFQRIGLSPWLVGVCEKLGMVEPTPVQKNCIKPTLDGFNIIASAPTGSGKTAAFALPILEKLAIERYGVFAVVVTPTRELAFQISDQILALGSPLKVSCETIVGGMSLVEQKMALSKRPHFIVGTPGRIASHISGPDPPKVDRAAFLVLDEADRLLDDGFSHQLNVIFKGLPTSRQTLLYSATMTSILEKLKSKKNKRPVFEFHATSNDTTPTGLDERYMLVPHLVKPAYLAYVFRRFGSDQEGFKLKKTDEPFVFDQEKAKLIIVFVSTRKNCQLIGETLIQLGFKCSILHSGMSQNKRLAALGKFRTRVNNVLIATDVASRGLDIPQVDLVVNFDVPRTPEDYIHRVGRTARAGRIGLAITFVTQYDVKLVLDIENHTGKKLSLLPNVDEENHVTVLLNKVTNATKKAILRIQKYEDNKQV